MLTRVIALASCEAIGAQSTKPRGRSKNGVQPGDQRVMLHLHRTSATRGLIRNKGCAHKKSGTLLGADTASKIRCCARESEDESR